MTRLRSALPLFGVLLLAFVPYREFFGDRVPVTRDLLFYFFPLKAHLAEAVRAGELPWIDRYRWGGLPLLGAPSAAPFDPGNILFLLLPLGAAMKAWILLRLAVAVSGFAAFTRKWGVSNGASAVAGLAFGLGGVSVSFAPFAAGFTALSLLPWFGAFVLEVRQKADARSIGRLTLVTALIGLASCPEFYVYAAVLALVLCGGSPGVTDESRPPARRVAGALALTALLGAFLAAPALLPGFVTGLQSTRGPGGGTNLTFASQGAFPVARLKELLADGLVADWTSTGWAQDVPEYPYLPSVTPGRVALGLAALGLLAGRSGRLRAAVLAALGLLLALGCATPIWPLAARAVPILTSLRYPEKHLVLTGFGLAWLSTLGLSALERRLRPEVGRIAVPLMAVAILLDRERTARGLVATEPGAVLRTPPTLLDGLPRAAAEAPPPRLFYEDAYSGRPLFDPRNLAGANEFARRTLMPDYASLFGVAYEFELDYDLSLPRQAFEWTRLLKDAVPTGSPLPLRLARSVGVAGVVRTEAPAGGRGAPRLHLFASPLPPYRFARRLVHDGDGRRLFRRMLEEGFAPDTAYVRDASVRGLDALSAGDVVNVRDRPSALELDVEVRGKSDGFLLVHRLLETAEDGRLDGRPCRVVDVGFGFAGLRVPPGRHLVRLRPETRWVKIGVVMSLVSALAALLARHSSRPRVGGASSGARWV